MLVKVWSDEGSTPPSPLHHFRADAVSSCFVAGFGAGSFLDGAVLALSPGWLLPGAVCDLENDLKDMEGPFG